VCGLGPGCGRAAGGEGDIGCHDADGYFYLLDRLKEMIVTGGENVYSGEVEAVISAHPAVREVAVFENLIRSGAKS
jgi:acyl-CoA synthetase (AMP-forming)/AMP-acid ligase II